MSNEAATERIHLIALPDRSLFVSESEAHTWSEIKHTIFPCGRCSNAELQVYHNLMGIHRHQDAEKTMGELKGWMEQEKKDAE